MSLLPSQKLNTGEFFISVAAGLMLFLLPNDAKNQMADLGIAESYVLIGSLVIIMVLLMIIKRFEAVGAAMVSISVFTLTAFLVSDINGYFTKGSGYWPDFTEYQLITMFITWTVPFFYVVALRLLMKGRFDTNEARKSFTRFLTMSMRALMIIYFLVIFFVQLFPVRPRMTEDRTINLVLFNRIVACLNRTHETGMLYLLWHGLILAPLTFSLLILNPKIRWWQLLIISGAVGFTVELFQFSFNTGTACADDVLLYIAGGVAGMLVKYFLDLLRSVLTGGEDPYMLSFTYNPIRRKTSEPVMVIEEE